MNNDEIKSEIRSCIPGELLAHVQALDIDSDGIWVWFDDCVEHDTLGCHTAHAEGIDGIRDELGRFKLTTQEE